MTFPLQAALEAVPELLLVLAVLVGFGFGFALERAGFGQATKLAAQFYLTDMTVFKVMFSAIVTAMLGLVAASGLGIVELGALSTSAASQTYVWPMAIGGALLGVGFITAGYCPGTSIVSAASGNLDGLATIAGVVVGSLVYGWVYPLLGGFPESGARGHLFLYEWLGVHPAVVAAGIAVLAMLLFLGAEKVEVVFSRRAERRHSAALPAPAFARNHRRAFAVMGAATALTVTSMFIPVQADAEEKSVDRIDAARLAERVIERPWGVRVIDLRAREACAKRRILGSECVAPEDLGKLGLAYAPTSRDLVVVGARNLERAPDEALAYRGRVFVLDGGFAAYERYALTPPKPPKADATPEQRADYALRAGLNKALTGKAPPPPPPVKGFKAPKKKKGGGCG